MIEKIGDPVQGDGCLAASCSSLDHHDPVRSVSDNGILLFLNGADNVFQLYISVTSKLCLQDLIIDLHITFKLIDHFSTTDLILPLGSNVSMDFPQRCLIGCRPFVKIIEQSGHRCSPVIDQWKATVFLRKVCNSDIKDLRLIVALITEIYSSKKWRIHHFPEPAPQLDLLIACINLMEKCLLVIKVLIAVLIHLCVVFPVVLVHPFDFFLTCFYGIIQLSDPVTQSFCHMCKIFPSVFYCCHTP